MMHMGGLLKGFINILIKFWQSCGDTIENAIVSSVLGKEHA